MKDNQQEAFNSQIKAIFRGGKINKIDWGGESDKSEWNTWNIQHRLEYAMELASAMNQAAEAMQNERNEMAEKLKLMSLKCEHAQQALDIQKQIVFNNITESNEIKQNYITRIQSLENKIRLFSGN